MKERKNKEWNMAPLPEAENIDIPSVLKQYQDGEIDLICILGPTASGKTRYAVAVAREIDKLLACDGNAARARAEIISGDSRQVYRGMDIGTGKDLDEYGDVPYHLIDIVEPGYKYNVFEYQRDFLKAYEDIRRRGRLPILCGGTGLYVEAVLKGYRLLPVPENPSLRMSLADKSLEELTALLSTYKTLHNTTDVDTVKRAIRAIEIEEYYRHVPVTECSFPQLNSLIIGVSIERELRRRKITERLHRRLEEGMVDEVRGLLAEGVTPDSLIYYGLEYKYLTQYVIGELSYDEMVRGLEIAIHQFAKRQMTWFRGMERRGFKIHWLPYDMAEEQFVAEVCRLLER